MTSWQSLQQDLQAETGVVLLASGQLLKILGVALYPVEGVAEVVRLREMGAAKMGGVSTGIGFLGSPAWAIGAGAALGLFQGALSSAARKEGAALLLDADQKHLTLLRSGRAFPFSQIVNRDQPNPNLWRAERRVRQSVDCQNMSRADRNLFLARHGKTKSDLVNGSVEIDNTEIYVHDGGEFFTAETETGRMKIRWQHVVAFTPATA